MDLAVLFIFGVVYLGLALGRLPGLALDRTGVVLLGLIGLLALGRLSLTDLQAAVDVPTMALLFGLMVVSAQFRLGGFYTFLVRRLARSRVGPPALLLALIGVVGLLSAVLANDIVCLAVTPVLIEGCVEKRLDPKPFLLALACAANIGSAATLIGNPQNMLIGQVLHLSFGGYLKMALVPSVLGLVVCWALIWGLFRGRFERMGVRPEVEAPVFNPWQTSKGLTVLAILVGIFLFSGWPRELAALMAAGLLLSSRRMRSREMLGLVDWQLLLLFFCLFGINQAFRQAGGLDLIGGLFGRARIDLGDPVWLFLTAVPISNLISNVPAAMLLLPYAQHPLAGPALALSTTLAGNLVLVGSIANIIVVDQASALGVRITWGEHLRVGVPVTLATLALAGLWLFLVAGL